MGMGGRMGGIGAGWFGGGEWGFGSCSGIFLRGGQGMGQECSMSLSFMKRGHEYTCRRK